MWAMRSPFREFLPVCGAYTKNMENSVGPKLFRRPIELAQKGLRVSGEWVSVTRRTINRFTPSGKEYFLKNAKTMYRPGEVFKQRMLANALKAIRDHHTAPFYQGAIAQDIV